MSVRAGLLVCQGRAACVSGPGCLFVRPGLLVCQGRAACLSGPGCLFVRVGLINNVFVKKLEAASDPHTIAVQIYSDENINLSSHLELRYKKLRQFWRNICCQIPRHAVAYLQEWDKASRYVIANNSVVQAIPSENRQISIRISETVIKIRFHQSMQPEK